MTPEGRRGKPRPGSPAALLAVAVLLVAWCGGMVARAATTELIVSDPQTGLAIDGFDPVSYFIDGAPEPGRSQYELRFHDVIWRFRNPGNMAVFLQYPGSYEPRFGGYDPIAVGRGAPTPGNPLLWMISGQKLYLFYDPESKSQFRADTKRAISQAEANWSVVVHKLSH
jgi:hypothetical protein